MEWNEAAHDGLESLYQRFKACGFEILGVPADDENPRSHFATRVHLASPRSGSTPEDGPPNPDDRRAALF